MKCEECCHAEMCKWIDELEGRGCDFLSQGRISLNDINNALEASFRNGVRSAKVQKSGKWINDECGNVICSECKRFRRDCRYGHTNYCNHCGARMYEP